jgi:NTE family protein
MIEPMSGIGLVLGAGGVVGQAYHAGVLAMLEHDVGWDPRKADVIVGTSAGSITAALLRAGVPASELAAWTVRAPLSAEGGVLHRIVGTDIPEFPPFRPLHALKRRPDMPRWEMLVHAAVRPRQFRPRVAALALLAPGDHNIVKQLRILREVEGGSWPERDLWICAVRRSDGRRVVFGRPESPHAPLHLAIAASCALPGYFAPVKIDDDTYIDGGAHSPTNAAVLRNRHLDLVVVVSPMSGPAGLPLDLYGASRWHAGRLVRREVNALRAGGTDVVVFRPGREEHEAMGNDLMAGDRVDQVVQQAFLGAGSYAARRQIRELLTAVPG